MWAPACGLGRRAQISREISAGYKRLAELYGIIATTEARTLAGAIVKLRRGLALMDSDELKTATKMIESALAAIERDPGVTHGPDSPSR